MVRQKKGMRLEGPGRLGAEVDDSANAVGRGQGDLIVGNCSIRLDDGDQPQELEKGIA